MKKLNKKNRKGFTLVELVVVILIIAILASATFLGGATVIKQSRVTKAQNDLRLYSQYAQDALYENPSWAQDTKAGAVTMANMNKYLTSDMEIATVADADNEIEIGDTALVDSWENAYHAYFVYQAAGEIASPATADKKTDCAFIFVSAGADATTDATMYTYEHVTATESGNVVAKIDDTIAATDDLVTVVYLNEDGEVSVVSNAQ